MIKTKLKTILLNILFLTGCTITSHASDNVTQFVLDHIPKEVTLLDTKNELLSLKVHPQSPSIQYILRSIQQELGDRSIRLKRHLPRYYNSKTIPISIILNKKDAINLCYLISYEYFAVSEEEARLFSKEYIESKNKSKNYEFLFRLTAAPKQPQIE